MSERDDGPLYTLRPEGVRITVEPVAWMDVEEDGTRHGLRYWREGTHREVPLYVAPQPDHREVMRLALEALEAGDNAWALMNVEGIKQALRAALGEKK
jgi:hypothetical protein